MLIMVFTHYLIIYKDLSNSDNNDDYKMILNF